MVKDMTLSCDRQLMEVDLPVLGICYGMQVECFTHTHTHTHTHTYTHTHTHTHTHIHAHTAVDVWYVCCVQLLNKLHGGQVGRTESRFDGQFEVDLDTSCPLFE